MALQLVIQQIHPQMPRRRNCKLPGNLLDKVQADLCRITQFFIDRNTPGPSWGRWENPIYHTTIPGATQIVVNVSDLGKTFSKIQDGRLDGLNISSNLGRHSESIPGNVDANAVGLLYVLAH